jgi:hypothetical protein
VAAIVAGAPPPVVSTSAQRIPDPAREGSTDEETYPAFERTAAELATRIPFLLELIAQTTQAQEVS